ncbi:MAG: hypothetical protein OEO17_14960 [Gemmatimonadota bacterium]|nr:hypothetical protein [Gemmatimonadota bacterium]
MGLTEAIGQALAPDGGPYFPEPIARADVDLAHLMRRGCQLRVPSPSVPGYRITSSRSKL